MNYPRILALLGLLLSVGCGRAPDPSDRLLARLEPQGYVSDFAGVMRPADRRVAESLLAELDRRTSTQVAVVTLPSLEGADADDFANRLFEKWGIGRRGKDNGLLLLAAIRDRRARIEVGYGLEPVINDAKAGRILDKKLIPHFKQGDYSTGLLETTRTLAGEIARANGISLNTMADQASPSANTTPGWLRSLLSLLFFIAAVIIIIRHPILAFLFLGGGTGGGGFGGGFGGFGGGASGGGGAGRGW